MNKMFSSAILLLIIALCISCTETDSESPKVIATFPVTGATDVPSTVGKISVTFSEPMTDGSWSWVYSRKETFPDMTGQPYYLPDLRENILPVKLEPNTEYEIWINSEKFKNFKDQSGNPAIPFRLVFRTK